jgi:hypothetical protein
MLRHGVGAWCPGLFGKRRVSYAFHNAAGTGHDPHQPDCNLVLIRRSLQYGIEFLVTCLLKSMLTAAMLHYRNKTMKYLATLGIARLPIVEKVLKARLMAIRLSDNPHFPDPVPPVVVVRQAANELEAASLKARMSRNKDNKEDLHKKERALDLLLKQLAAHVEYTANQNPNMAEVVILSAGLKLRRRAKRRRLNFTAGYRQPR